MSTYHLWGSDFDFNKLEEIQERIRDEYQCITGCCVLSTKEKYGTIRYEEYNPVDWEVLASILDTVIQDYPEFAGEIVNDIIPNLEDSNIYKKEFKRLLWDQHGEKWETVK